MQTVEGRRTSCPALVVGFGVHGLAIARSLGRRGIAVEALDTDVRQPHRLSRHCRRLHVAQSLDDNRLIDQLLRYGRRARRRTALFLTRDRTVPVVSAHRDVLQEHFDFTLPAHSAVEDLMHKSRVTDFLDRSGTQYPRTRLVRDAQALGAAGDAVGFPCILKPTLRSDGFKAARVSSHVELAEAFASANRHYHEFVVQEWISGADTDVYFAFVYVGRDGMPMGIFVGRKLHQHPRGTGIAAAAEGCENEFVRRETLRLFALAHYRGFGSAEFRRDPVSQTYRLIEFTVGRTDYNVACAVANGVDLPWIGYQDSVNQALPGPSPLQVNRARWIDVGRTLKVIVEERREDGGSRFRAMAQFLRYLAPSNTFTLFAADDLTPYLGHLLARAAHALCLIPRKLIKLIARTGTSAPGGVTEWQE